MCGITGCLGFNDPALVKKMTQKLKHRGPDQEGFFSSKNIEFGHRRLSIIDLSKGKQPIFNEDGSIAIVYNGEVYNYRYLKGLLDKHKFKTNSDTEVIVHLYEEFGSSFVKRLDGIFAFAIFDAKKQKVLLARDRAGTKPLYYFMDKERLVFSSEIKSLLEDKKIERDINFNVLKEYLQFGFCGGPETIIKKIFKVLPGEILVYELRTKEIRKERYFDFNFSPQEGKLEDYSKEFLDTFKSVVEGQLMSEVPWGIYLSGGLDSSAVVAMTRAIHPDKKIYTYSTGFDSSEVTNELNYAKIVAAKFNTTHKEIVLHSDALKELPNVISVIDEPIMNLSALPLYFMAREASKQIKVVLSGNGSDELFAGYLQHRMMNFLMRNRNLMKATRPFAVLADKAVSSRKTKFLSMVSDPKLNFAEIYQAFKFSEPNHDLFLQSYRGNLKKDESLSEILASDFSALNRLTLIDLKKLLPENYLMIDDKVNMNFSIESRVPFLGNRMIELSERLPDRYKSSFSKGKIILREAMKDILPAEVISRKKYGFTAPATSWFQNNKENIRQHVLKESAVYKFLDKSKVEKLFESDASENINRIWSLLFLNLWVRGTLENEEINYF